MPGAERIAQPGFVFAELLKQRKRVATWPSQPLEGIVCQSGRVTASQIASQIASASAASFFCRLTYGFT